jgi:hypothetical protein
MVHRATGLLLVAVLARAAAAGHPDHQLERCVGGGAGVLQVDLDCTGNPLPQAVFLDDRSRLAAGRPT